MIGAVLNRRRLLALLGLSPAAASVGVASPVPPPMSGGGSLVKLVDTRVNGTAYHDAHLSLPTLQASDPLILRREPANPRDKRAIEVMDMAGRKLGYVARGDNSAVARMMDAGEVFVAHVASLDRDRWDIRLSIFWLRLEFVG